MGRLARCILSELEGLPYAHRLDGNNRVHMLLFRCITAREIHWGENNLLEPRFMSRMLMKPLLYHRAN